MTNIALQPAPRVELAGSPWLYVCALIIVLVAMAWFAVKWRQANRELEQWRRSTYDRAAMDREDRLARWEPAFYTSDNELRIMLRRTAVNAHGRRVLNSITVGSVNTDAEGWEAARESLVITARACMADLNAFIDSYTEGRTDV